MSGRGGACVAGCRVRRFRSAQVETPGGRDRRRTGRVSEVAETVVRTSRQRGVQCSGRGRCWTSIVRERKWNRGGLPHRQSVRDRTGVQQEVAIRTSIVEVAEQTRSYQAVTVNVASSKQIRANRASALDGYSLRSRNGNPSQPSTGEKPGSRVGTFGRRPGTEVEHRTKVHRIRVR